MNVVFRIRGLDLTDPLACRMLQRLERVLGGADVSDRVGDAAIMLLRITLGLESGLEERGAKRLHLAMRTSLIARNYQGIALSITEAQTKALVLALRKGRGRNRKRDGEEDHDLQKHKHRMLASVLGEILREDISESSVRSYLKKAK